MLCRPNPFRRALSSSLMQDWTRGRVGRMEMVGLRGRIYRVTQRSINPSRLLNKPGLGVPYLEVHRLQCSFLVIQVLDSSSCSKQCTASIKFDKKHTGLSSGSAQARFGDPYLEAPHLLCSLLELQFLDFSWGSKSCTSIFKSNTEIMLSFPDRSGSVRSGVFRCSLH